jgi:hypothetical protein
MSKVEKQGIQGLNHLMYVDVQTGHQSWVTQGVSFQNYPAFLLMVPYQHHPREDHFLSSSLVVG